VISKLNSREKFDLINGALKALQIENERFDRVKDQRKMSNEELKRATDDAEYAPLALKHHLDANSQQSRPNDAIQEFPINKEEMRKLRTRVEELENENKDLLGATVKLDEQHAQSIGK